MPIHVDYSRARSAEVRTVPVRASLVSTMTDSPGSIVRIGAWAAEKLYCGGNMDNKFVRPGCSLHLPVLIPGANLALGDVHASMGDGEVSMVGLETEAEVTIKVDLLKGVEIGRPWLEDDARWITTGDGMETGEALRMACREMVALLMRRLKISFEQAYMLASIRADLAICQACDPERFPVTTRMSYEFQRVENDV
jgi:acetamidase/formamidase